MRDLPAPVGIKTKASRPANACSMISCCPGRKASCPKYCLRCCSIFSKTPRPPRYLLLHEIISSVERKFNLCIIKEAQQHSGSASHLGTRQWPGDTTILLCGY